MPWDCERLGNLWITLLLNFWSSRLFRTKNTFINNKVNGSPGAQEGAFRMGKVREYSSCLPLNITCSLSISRYLSVSVFLSHSFCLSIFLSVSLSLALSLPLTLVLSQKPFQSLSLSPFSSLSLTFHLHFLRVSFLASLFSLLFFID